MNETTSKDEVMDALVNLMSSGDEGRATTARTEIKVTAMWPTRRGELVAMAEVPHNWSKRDHKIRIGWTCCSV